ncbi:MAG: enoyl-CoA hydratase/isomerase family protein [Sporichthyaceae bacterium]
MSELTLERGESGVAVLTLNRPDRLNAFDRGMLAEIEACATALNRDPDLRVVVLTGAGRAFCAGYDLAEAAAIGDMGPMEFLELQEQAARAVAAVRSIRVPVIAAVNGPASGGGFALALAADLRLAATSAVFHAGMVKIGFSIGDMGTSWLLSRLVGPGLAAEIAYTADPVDAAAALTMRLVNRVLDTDELLPAALDLAGRIAANPAAGIRLSKSALQASLEIPSFAAALELENRGQAVLARTADLAEAIAAIRERRPPRFVGR